MDPSSAGYTQFIILSGKAIFEKCLFFISCSLKTKMFLVWCPDPPSKKMKRLVELDETSK
jgi:hypothetical protein